MQSKDAFGHSLRSLPAQRGIRIASTPLLVKRIAFIAAAVAAMSMLSCMSLNIGGKVYESSTEDGVLTQQGHARIPAGAFLDVFYPVPYASPPNLDTSDTWSSTNVVEQHATHFRIKNDSMSAEMIDWTARGVRCPPMVTPAAPSPPVLPPPNVMGMPRGH